MFTSQKITKDVAALIPKQVRDELKMISRAMTTQYTSKAASNDKAHLMSIVQAALTKHWKHHQHGRDPSHLPSPQVLWVHTSHLPGPQVLWVSRVPSMPTNNLDDAHWYLLFSLPRGECNFNQTTLKSGTLEKQQDKKETTRYINSLLWL